MLDNLNLASSPFRNRTLPYLIAAAVSLVAFVAAVFGLAQYRNDTGLNAVVKSDIQEMSEQVRVLKERGDKVRQEMSPAQQQLMIAAHTLVAHKDFSWSRLLSDLEQVIPGSVSASRINVENVYRERGQLKAQLDFSVLAQDYQGVLEMIRRMNDGGIFKASLRGQDLQKGARVSYSEFTLRLIYSPRAGFAPGTETNIVRNADLGIDE